MVGYFSGTVDWDVCPQPSLPPSPHSHPSSYSPPSQPHSLAFIAVSRLRCRQSSTSSSRSALFFHITVCGYLTPLLLGQQIFCPVQQLERCGLFNQDLEGTETPPSDPRPSPPLTGVSALGLYQGRQLPRARTEAREPQLEAMAPPEPYG